MDIESRPSCHATNTALNTTFRPDNDRDLYDDRDPYYDDRRSPHDDQRDKYDDRRYDDRSDSHNLQIIVIIIVEQF